MQINRRQLNATFAALACLPLSVQAAYQITPWPSTKAVPPLTLKTLEGQSWSLVQARGKVVLLNFWASWCEPCRAEMPALMALAQKQAQDLTVVGINYQEGTAKVQRFLESNAVSLPVILLDSDGAAARAWTRRIFPCTVVIDRAGRPRQVLTGEFDWTSPQADTLLAPLVQAFRK